MWVKKKKRERKRKRDRDTRRGREGVTGQGVKRESDISGGSGSVNASVC